ncbi:sialidase family protein [Heyndrickxia oleronia]|uniref:sialidase family protein n=1 Tax=Heyndrickxia oleronia TaxID=38875 RepID=UPI001B0AE306|nr:sialidase family protein [Heyndrickxia oleronia]GIN38377.1 hypothetical protein J19TS1_13260 [Heyndrickxia oleronia]
MPLQQLGEYTKLISSLDDIPIMSAADLKAYFDSAPEEIRDAYNKAIAVLLSVTDGDSGADNIGATKIKDVDGETVQTILESLKVLIDKKIGTTDVFTKKELESTTEGSSGASKIKTSPISGLTGDNVQSFLKALKDTIDQLALNQIPDGSITINKLNDNVKDLFNNVGDIYKSVAYLMLEQEASKRVTKGGTFGTSFNTTYGMEFDTFKSSSQNALSIGDTEIILDSVQGLTVGKEITIYDDVNLERRTVSAISGNTITVYALTKEFKPQSNIARSMVIIDSVNEVMKFGGWDYSVLTNQVDKVVTQNKFETDGNGGRKLIRLNNGWIIAVAKDRTNLQLKLYVSKNNGSTFENFNTSPIPMSKTTDDVALACKGNNIYLLRVWGNAVSFVQFDINGNIIGAKPVLIQDLKAVGNVSLEVDPSTGRLHAAWSSKSTLLPNSFNIQYANSSDNGDTWSSVQNLSEWNDGTNLENPTVAIAKGKVVILYQYRNTTQGMITGTVLSQTGTKEKSIIVFNPGNFTQYTPSVVVDIYGSIHLVWYGTDSSNAIDNIYYSKSEDAGFTWSPVRKLTNDTKAQRNPSITSDKFGNLYVVWAGISNISLDALGLRRITCNQGTWNDIVDIKGSQGYNNNYPQTLVDLNMVIVSPLFIYSDAKDAKVGFYGEWKNLFVNEILENDVRFKTDDTTRIAMWIEHDLDLNITGQWNGLDLQKSVDGTETQLKTDPVQKQPSEVKLTMKRNTVDDDLKVTRILGGFA